MSRRLRQLLAVLFFLLFAGSVPVVLLTTAGYRINLRTQRLEKTGMFLIRSLPRDAEVLLDGQPTGKRTPARLARLLPRDYHLTIKKDGYLPYEKTLAVTSNRTTFAEQIILFSTRLPERVSTDQTTSLSVGPNGMLAYDVRHPGVIEIWIQSPGQPARVATRLSAVDVLDVPIVEWQWSTSGEHLLVILDGEPRRAFAIQTIGDPSSQEVGSAAAPFRTAAWNDNAQEELFFVAGNELRLAVGNGRVLPQVADRIQSLTVQDGTLFIQESATSSMSVSSIAPNGTPIHAPLVTLPRRSLAFLPSPNGILTLLGDGRLVLVDADSGEVLFETAALRASWNNAGTELLFDDHYEISVYTRASRQAQLMTRLGQEIDSVAWYPGDSHILFHTNDQVSAIERDDRGGRNTSQLFTLPELSQAAVDPETASIYAIAAPDHRPGLYRYPILVP